MAINEKFLSGYEPHKYENDIYKTWEESGFFNPDICVEKGVVSENAEKFSIVLPPPNVTGTLHTGHASMLAIQDTMVRFARMRGLKTLWLPGTDHAAIATQSKVEKLLEKDGIRKHDLGREEFLKRVEQFAQDSHDTIVSQCRAMGSSLDWSREAYTLDETRHKAVFSAFKKMYEDGLIYKAGRIVNWDPKGQTTISDDEVVYQEEKSKFYYFQYGPFVIGTARPETKFADKYIVVHPNDERYSQYSHLQEFEVEWINGPIKATLIKDEVADPEKGTGAMTITPWHSQVDFELARKYNLPIVQIIDKYGKLLPIAGEDFTGMKIAEAREKIVAKLESKGLVTKIDENYTHNIATAERSGGIIEPQVMDQWWIDVNKPIKDGKSLKDLMLEVVQDGQIEILPDRFEKIYFHWIKNLRDWNISRQIWYGHRIPAWYKDGEIKISMTSPGENWIQDEDTLDTWFSSGLWTFSTLLDPEKYEEDLKAWLSNSRDSIYHPTTVLETGYDIIFFWVARMILMTTYLVDDTPFKTVYLHGLVRDKQGRKMSKSLGNIIDPVDVIKDSGADALRMALIVGIGPGADNNLSDDKIKAYRKFANKIWNASRFVLENTEGTSLSNTPELQDTHKAYIEEWKALVAEITKEMEEYKLYLVGEKLYHFFWHRFADVVIEDCKKDLNESSKYTLLFLLTEQLKALHPFMPFITEEIWKSLENKDSELLMVSKWPN
jgi:valyl-tRNA synthetase